MELPTGGEPEPDAGCRDRAGCRAADEPSPSRSRRAPSEPSPTGPVTAVSLGLLPEVFVSQVSTQLLFYAPEIAPLPERPLAG